MLTCDDGNIPYFPCHVNSSIGSCDVSFTSAKVLQILRGLKPKNSYGPGGYPNIFVKNLANVLCEACY